MSRPKDGHVYSRHGTKAGLFRVVAHAPGERYHGYRVEKLVQRFDGCHYEMVGAPWDYLENARCYARMGGKHD